jgi:ABC-2 type transport system ATP-binding protein
MQTPVIQTENLTKYYGKNIGIKNLNLKVNSGEIFGFLGPNGAGKTTTIRLFLDLIRPTSGKATIFGYDTQKEIEKIHNKIAYIPGELEFNKNWTGHRTIKHMFSLYNQSSKWSIVTELAEILKLNLEKKVKELSKGNKQKIGIILALAPDVELLILDEPTSGLDPLIKNKFYKLLREKQAKSNCSVFLSSHLLHEVEKVAHRVAIINQGLLVEVATLGQLQRLAMKNIVISFSNPQEAKKNQQKLPKELAKKPTVKDGTLSLLSNRENLKNILSWLKTTSFKDLDIRNPTLEDLFLDYYKIEPREKVSQNNNGGGK